MLGKGFLGRIYVFPSLLPEPSWKSRVALRLCQVRMLAITRVLNFRPCGFQRRAQIMSGMALSADACLCGCQSLVTATFG